MPRIDRQAIYERDAGICGVCLAPVPFGEVEIDHIIPKMYGGPSESYNLRPTHGPCNRARMRGMKHPGRPRPTWLRPPLKTVAQAADYLQVNADTVRRWCRTGVLRCTPLGDRAGYRIRQEDLDKFLEDRRAKD